MFHIRPISVVERSIVPISYFSIFLHTVLALTIWTPTVATRAVNLGVMSLNPSSATCFPTFDKSHCDLHHSSMGLVASTQETGVPQGCILSVTHCSVQINNIIKSVNPGVECFLNVDGFCICYRSKHMHTIERQLQQVLNDLQKWSNENGFKFSKSKTNECTFVNFVNTT